MSAEFPRATPYTARFKNLATFLAIGYLACLAFALIFPIADCMPVVAVFRRL